MTKKLKITLCVTFALLLLLLAVVMVGCGKTDNGESYEYGEIVVKSGTIKTEYEVGEELEVTGGILEFTQNDKTTHVAITKNMISNFSTERAGSFSMIVTYKGNTTSVSYTVYEAFDMTKIYKSTNTSLPTVWFKFNTQSEKFYMAQGLAAAPTTEEEWATYGAIGTYTKKYNNGVLCVTITVTNPDSSTVTAEMTTLTRTSIKFSDGQTTLILDAVN